MFRLRLLVAVIVLLTAAVLPALSKDSDEVELGRKLAERFEEKAKLITDEALLEQVNDIGQRLAEVARTLEVPAGYGSSDLAGFDYQFKVVDNEDINAFSLPGGIIYIYSGLIDFVETDDELAGVLAHEIAHASHHHVMALSKKQSKMDAVIALVALAGGLGKMDGRDLINIIYGAQSIRTARITGYSREAELDADNTAVVYMYKAGFNPKGILQFLRRLDSQEEQRGEVRNLGIFQTHPPTDERALCIAEKCAALGIPVDIREIAHLAKARVEKTEINGQQMHSVVLADRTLCTLAECEGLSSQERAEQICATLNKLLDEGINPKQVAIDLETAELRCGKTVLFSVNDNDTAACGLPVSVILTRAADAVRFAVWSDWVKTGWNNSELYQAALTNSNRPIGAGSGTARIEK